MLSILLLAAAAQATPCDAPTTFSFVGQPACVALDFDGAHTQLRNDCEQGVLVDQSVVIGATGGPMVAPGEAATLRDLSAFTLGLDGTIHRVVAVIDAPVCEPEPEPEPEPEAVAEPEGSLFGAVLGAVTGSWSH